MISKYLLVGVALMLAVVLVSTQFTATDPNRIEAPDATAPFTE